MKANEIREGVYLKWKDNEQEFDVTIGLMLDKYFWNHVKKGDIIPILLTEQWLKDFGLRYYERDNKWHFAVHFRIGINYNMNIWIDGNIWDNIKYVHLLQNIYFALTKEELIKT